MLAVRDIMPSANRIYVAFLLSAIVLSVVKVTNRSPFLQPFQLLSRDEIGGNVGGVVTVCGSSAGVNVHNLKNRDNKIAVPYLNKKYYPEKPLISNSK